MMMKDGEPRSEKKEERCDERRGDEG